MDEPNAKSLALLSTIENGLALILVHLSKSPIDPLSDQLLLSGILEATFDGYAPVKLLLEACDVPNDTHAELASQEVVFTAGEQPTPELIYFAYCTQMPVGGLTSLVQIYEFPEPVKVVASGQEISTGAWRFKQTD